MRDLNYQLKQLCQHNRDGSYATQAQRQWILKLIANQLHGLGFRQMDMHSLKPKHVEALAKHWLAEGLAVATIKNRMSALRWWAAKVNRQNVIARSNDHYGIPERQFVTNESKAQTLIPETLARVRDDFVRVSLELQAVFGLRREEAIKFMPSYADRGDTLVLKDTWTKGGKAREIPIRTSAQREVLERAHRVAGRGSLIPSNRNYVEQLRMYEGHTLKAGLSKLHGLRHAYAQQRYLELTGRACPAAAGLPPRHTIARAESPGSRSPAHDQSRAWPRTGRNHGGVPWSLTPQTVRPPIFLPCFHGCCASATPLAISAWTATVSTRRSGPTSLKSRSVDRALRSTALNWTPGSTTINPATDVPVNSKEN